MKDAVIIRNADAYDHSIELSDKSVVTVNGTRKYPQNIVILKKEQFDLLKETRFYNRMLESGRFEVLDEVPQNYFNAAEQVAKAKGEVSELKKQLDVVKKDLEKSNVEVVRLKKILTDAGVKDK
jgi:hypothetical protein